MLGYINGLVLDKDEKNMLILAGSIGYKVGTSTEVLSNAIKDQKIQLFLHTAVREDDISLYGFRKKEELEFFEQLLGVSGIGPKMAMEILSSPLHMTQQAILNGDVAILTNIKGLGKKTAERLILELKSKITPISIQSDGSAAKSAYNEEAVLALVGLGYEKFEVIKTLSAMPSEIEETEEVIKYFLKQA